ncbi:hypothetical protein SERLA73DRAFT_153057 [Serpula lacrymans var. lacrymans S7.3]|uniref:Uncharacterized protein n=1 Tax=Serpula lacrymans var. lacrymans (strain S7.3) TaxID=936435 RepID=F8PXH7_SERL3|nr:hypothetical protein SERLA73DRAFT_153057 [Serpula lacrymans var. lacrymans S7.3]
MSEEGEGKRGRLSIVKWAVELEGEEFSNSWIMVEWICWKDFSYVSGFPVRKHDLLIHTRFARDQSQIGSILAGNTKRDQAPMLRIDGGPQVKTRWIKEVFRALFSADMQQPCLGAGLGERELHCVRVRGGDWAYVSKVESLSHHAASGDHRFLHWISLLSRFRPKIKKHTQDFGFFSRADGTISAETGGCRGR